MKKSLLQFLAERGEIPAEALVRAQQAQLKALPSPMDLALQLSLVRSDQALAILLRQESTGSSFSVAATALGHWSPELDRELREEYTARRLSLGELLRQDPVVHQGQLEAALCEYEGKPAPALEIAERAIGPTASFKAPKGKAASPTGQPTLVAQAASLSEALSGSRANSKDSEVEDPILHEALISLDLLLDKLAFSETSQTTRLLQQELKQNFHRIKGLMRFRASSLEIWAARGEELMRLTLENTNPSAPTIEKAGRKLVELFRGESAPPAEWQRMEREAVLLMEAVKASARAAKETA
jgi:hypothetical protein